MTALVWSDDGRHTIPERFAVQRERPLHEPTVWSLVCRDADDAGVLPQTDIETAFYGRGGAAKVRQAAQQLADIVDPLRVKYAGSSLPPQLIVDPDGAYDDDEDEVGWAGATLADHIAARRQARG